MGSEHNGSFIVGACLQLKLFYQNGNNADKVFHSYGGQKSLCTGPETNMRSVMNCQMFQGNISFQFRMKTKNKNTAGDG